MKTYTRKEIKQKLGINESLLQNATQSMNIEPCGCLERARIKKYFGRDVDRIERFVNHMLKTKKTCLTCSYRIKREFGFCKHCVNKNHYKRGVVDFMMTKDGGKKDERTYIK